MHLVRHIKLSVHNLIFVIKAGEESIFEIKLLTAIAFTKLKCILWVCNCMTRNFFRNMFKTKASISILIICRMNIICPCWSTNSIDNIKYISKVSPTLLSKRHQNENVRYRLSVVLNRNYSGVLLSFIFNCRDEQIKQRLRRKSAKMLVILQNKT